MAGNKYPEVTERIILDTAKKLFLGKGYEQVTLQGIADACGLTRGAIYHHFKGKEEVLDAVTTDMFNKMTVDSELNENASLNGLEKLQRLIITSLSNRNHIQMYAMLSQSFYKSPKLVSAYLQDCQRSAVPRIQTYIDEGVRDGSILAGDTEIAAELIAVFTNLWLSPWLFKTTKERFLLKVKYIRTMLESIGIYLVNEEVISAVESAATIIFQNE